MLDTKFIQKKYNKQARSYDKKQFMMEYLISKARNIFRFLKGTILEVGVGTGNNLAHYRSSVNLTVLDFSAQMLKQSRLKIKKLKLYHVKKLIKGDIQHLSKYFKEHSFDFITSTFVFCSVPDPIKGLQEAKRILRPNGRLVQIDHGLSNIKIVNYFLKFFDPLTVKLFGFHISRDILNNLKKSGFKIIRQRTLDPAGILRLIISVP
ncbi:MAG: class I SAM-dependent methyltransferase [Promethearchaeota archaeon]|jgi:ubiquinone/menaquinone biosynthesis C-methylase UbiE